MNYKELKHYIELLSASSEATVNVDRKLLLDIANEALIYRKKNAVAARTKVIKQKPS